MVISHILVRSMFCQIQKLNPLTLLWYRYYKDSPNVWPCIDSISNDSDGDTVGSVNTDFITEDPLNGLTVGANTTDDGFGETDQVKEKLNIRENTYSHISIVVRRGTSLTMLNRCFNISNISFLVSKWLLLLVSNVTLIFCDFRLIVIECFWFFAFASRKKKKCD